MNKDMNDLNRDSSRSDRSDSSMDSERSQREGFGDRLGDAIEKAGHKISEAGAPGLGQKIHDLGDKLEKKHDNPNHPHDV